MPASILEAFKSPLDKNTSSKGQEQSKNYNDSLTAFFPKIDNAPAPYVSTSSKEPQVLSGPTGSSGSNDTGREQMRLYTGPAAQPMRTHNSHEECHDKIANILACRFCREKLMGLLNSSSNGVVQSGGSRESFLSTNLLAGANPELVNMFLILGMILILHKLFKN
jgi:hypothetical protein